MNNVIVFGTGSLAELVHFYLERDSDYNVVAFCADAEYIEEDSFLGLPLIAWEELPMAMPPETHKMFIAIGYKQVNQVRAERYHAAKAAGYELITYVSSKCTHWGDTPIGDNCFIFENNNIQPFVTIGSDNIIWSGNHIGHHGTIGNHCFLTSHVVVSGHVRIHDYAFLGVNATIRDSIEIAESTVIGAGALVMRSTKPREVYISERTPLYKKSSDRIKL